MILPVLFAQPSPPGDNVALDDERLKDDVPKGLQKVELDLDDALFLEFEDKEEEPPPPTPEPLPEAPPQPQKKSGSKKKLLLLAMAGLIVLLLGAGAAYFFLRPHVETPPSNATAPEPTQEAPAAHGQGGHEQAKEQGHGKNETAKQPKPPVQKSYILEPFQVEYSQGNQTRFLACKISLPNLPELTHLEVTTRILPIRDSVYRSLKQMPVTFLDDPANADKLKKELLAAVNRVVKSGQVKEIYIDDYVVK